jgi:hypothetical protein
MRTFNSLFVASITQLMVRKGKPTADKNGEVPEALMQPAQVQQSILQSKSGLEKSRTNSTPET